MPPKGLSEGRADDTGTDAVATFRVELAGLREQFEKFHHDINDFLKMKLTNFDSIIAEMKNKSDDDNEGVEKKLEELELVKAKLEEICSHQYNVGELINILMQPLDSTPKSRQTKSTKRAKEKEREVTKQEDDPNHEEDIPSENSEGADDEEFSTKSKKRKRMRAPRRSERSGSPKPDVEVPLDFLNFIQSIKPTPRSGPVATTTTTSSNNNSSVANSKKPRNHDFRDDFRVTENEITKYSVTSTYKALNQPLLKPASLNAEAFEHFVFELMKRGVPDKIAREISKDISFYIFRRVCKSGVTEGKSIDLWFVCYKGDVWDRKNNFLDTIANKWKKKKQEEDEGEP